MKAPPAASYTAPPEGALGRYLLLAVGLVALATLAGRWLPHDERPPTIEVDLGVEGVPNEPPPLGTPDAGAGEIAPPTPPPAEPPAPNPEPPPP